MCNTKHNASCTMAFSRPSQHNDCQRCNELKAGAEPRKGWHANKPHQYSGNGLSAYCFNVSIYHSYCTKETNPR